MKRACAGTGHESALVLGIAMGQTATRFLQVLITVDEEGVYDLADLQRDLQRDGNHRAVQQEEP